MTRGKVGLIDYGMGNLLSVRHALEALGAEVLICREPEEFRDVARLVLPGVGAFGDCMRNLRAADLDDALRESVQLERKPILGICLGMQAFARGSQEGGGPGLGLVAGDVVKVDDGGGRLRVPHIGWNEVRPRRFSHMFEGVPDRADLYFVHSYALLLDDSDDVEATTDYGTTLTAAIRRAHVWGTQFHPEKSQRHGLRVLRNFLDWGP